MKPLKQKVTSFFKRRKVNVFLLFTLLALLFSVLTKLSKDYTKTIIFNIQPTNIPEDKLIISDSSNVLKVDLRTYGFKLLRYYFKKPTLKIDVERLDKDDTHYIWTQRKAFSEVVSQFDPNVKIENINPDTLRLAYGTNSVKKIPVLLKTNINFTEGFNVVGDFNIQPDSIRVIGPNVLIDTITSVSTNRITINDIKSDINKSLKLELIDNEQLKFSDKNVQLKAKVDKFTEGTVNVPVIVKNVPEHINLKIYPKVIPVVFYSSLTNFKAISNSSFIVACDYSKREVGKTYLVPELVQEPKQIKTAKLSIKKVEFIITE